jgi:hypothetical protein
MRSRSLAAAVVGLAALLTVTTTSSASPLGAGAQNCVPKNDIEAIVDDSGSMILTDPNRLRVQAMDLFINAEGANVRLGAIQFGSEASRVFAPEAIGPNVASMKSLLDTEIQADNGQTDYDAAFNLAGSENPTAQARIFLTDGAHNAPDLHDYANSHRGGPPVYVLGLGVVGDGDQVLQRIADETGGLYRRVDTSGELQPRMFDIEAAVSCLAAPITLKNTFTKQGQSRGRSVRLPAGVKSVTTALTWEDSGDRFDIAGIKVVRKGKRVAAARVRKLKVVKHRGATFETVKISRLVRGRLKFKLRAVRLTGGGNATLTTQLVRSKKR